MRGFFRAIVVVRSGNRRLTAAILVSLAAHGIVAADVLFRPHNGAEEREKVIAVDLAALGGGTARSLPASPASERPRVFRKASRQRSAARPSALPDRLNAAPEQAAQGEKAAPIGRAVFPAPASALSGETAGTFSPSGSTAGTANAAGDGAGADEDAGETIPITSMNEKYRGYLGSIYRIVNERWTDPRSRNSRDLRQGRTVAEFVIAKSGALERVEITWPSGHGDLDAAVAAAITASSPFPRIPDTIRKRESLRLKITFFYHTDQAPDRRDAHAPR